MQTTGRLLMLKCKSLLHHRSTATEEVPLHPFRGHLRLWSYFLQYSADNNSIHSGFKILLRRQFRFPLDSGSSPQLMSLSGLGLWSRGFCVWEARWWLLLIDLHLETIIREADVRHTGDPSRKHWLLWVTDHWYSCAGRRWQTEQGTLFLRVSDEAGGEAMGTSRGCGWMTEERKGDRRDWNKERKREENDGNKASQCCHLHMRSLTAILKTKCFIARMGRRIRPALWMSKSLGLDSYIFK